MQNQEDKITLFDVKILNDALNSLSINKNFDKCNYENVKEHVGAIESLRMALITLDKLQTLAKKSQDEENNILPNII